MREFLDRRPWLLTVAAAVVMGVILTVLGLTAPKPSPAPHPASEAITSTPKPAPDA